MDEFLKDFRYRAARAWDERTVSPKFLPIDTSKPASLGQCAATSAVLVGELRRNWPDAQFALAIVEVRQGTDLIIPYHVWVVELGDSPKQNKVIDVTGDQSEALPSITHQTIASLAADGTYYIAYQISTSGVFMHAEARRRRDILRQKMEG